jgi:hypothetical protein
MARAWLGMGVVALAACAPAAPDGAAPARSGAILGGTPDSAHDAVLAELQLLGGNMAYACSGTTIAQSGSSAYLLTAAHCVVEQDAMMNILKPVTVVATSSLVVLPGPDWQTSLSQGHRYAVSQISVAPGYDGAAGSPRDLAVVRFTSPSSLPVIPILEAADDDLAAGDTLTLVGYGVTETGGPNSLRRAVDRSIDTLTPLVMIFLQNDEKGGCSGDSGGPALARLAGGERVAGVFAATHDLPQLNLYCRQESEAVRVSSLASFVHGVIGPASAADGGAAVDVDAAADERAPVDAAEPPDVSGPAAPDASLPDAGAFVAPAADAGPGATDAGTTTDAGGERSGPPTASSGCGCDVHGRRSVAWPWLGILIAAVAARSRRRADG